MINRILIVSITTTLLCSCYKSAGDSAISSKISRRDLIPFTYQLAPAESIPPPVYFPTFQTSLYVSMVEPIDSIYRIPANSFYKAFAEHEKELGEDILRAAYDWYIKAYPIYKKIWIMRGKRPTDFLSGRLPPVTSHDLIKRLISPDGIHARSNALCEEGTFGMRIGCNWEVWDGLGIEVKNWRVVQVGFEDILPFYMFPYAERQFPSKHFLNMPSAPLFVNYR